MKVRDRLRAWLRRGPAALAVGALAVVLAGCQCTPDEPARRPEPPPAQGDQPAVTGGARGTVTIPDTDGTPLWRVGGNVRFEAGLAAGALRIYNAAAQAVPERYDASAVAGRVRWSTGEDDVLFDRRLYLTSPSRAASVETESARFSLREHTFTLDRPTLARFGPTRLEVDSATAFIDLRRLTATEVQARHEADDSVWTARAETARVDEEQRIFFDVVTGTVAVGEDRAAFRAPTAVWKPAQAWLNFAEGVTFSNDDFTVRAAQATWQQADERVLLRGEIRLQRDDLTVVGAGGEVDLAARTATVQRLRAVVRGVALQAARGRLRADGSLVLDDLRAQAPEAVLSAPQATVAPDGTITLSNPRATLADDGTVVTAPRAVYHPQAQRLELSGGVRADNEEVSLRADRVVWDAGDETITAIGSVRLTSPEGTVSGERLTAPADLSSARLQPVTAEGERDGQRWTLQAGGGTWTRGGLLRLEEASATFIVLDRRFRARAGTVVFDSAAGVVRFDNGFRATSVNGDVTARADRARYTLASRTLQAWGNVEATVRGVAVKGREWTYYLGDAPGTDGGKLVETSGRAPVPADRRSAPADRRSAPADRRSAPAGADGLPPVEPPGADEGSVKDSNPDLAKKTGTSDESG